MTRANEFMPIGSRKYRNDGIIINEANGITFDGTQRIKEVATPRKALAFSETTLLEAGGSYITPTIDALSFSCIKGIVFSDQPGTIYFEHSDDGLAWIRDRHNVSVNANEGTTYSQEIFERYIRLVFSNSGEAQTKFTFRATTNP